MAKVNQINPNQYCDFIHWRDDEDRKQEFYSNLVKALNGDERALEKALDQARHCGKEDEYDGHCDGL